MKKVSGLKQIDRGVSIGGIWYDWDEYIEFKKVEHEGVNDEIKERNDEIWNAHVREVMGGLK